jgi:hypothetical protein
MHEYLAWFDKKTDEIVFSNETLCLYSCQSEMVWPSELKNMN